MSNCIEANMSQSKNQSVEQAKKFLKGDDFEYSKVPAADEGHDGLHADYECCICMAPAFEPVQHESCGQMFCKNCVDDLNDCPTCRAAPLVAKPVTLKLVLNKLNALKVVCPSCKKDVLRRELQNHVKDCPILCEFCGISYKPGEQLVHQQSVCLFSPVRCSAEKALCPWQGRRKSLPEHEKSCHFVALSPVLMDLINKSDIASQFVRLQQVKSDNLQKQLDEQKNNADHLLRQLAEVKLNFIAQVQQQKSKTDNLQKQLDEIALNASKTHRQLQQQNIKTNSMQHELNDARLQSDKLKSKTDSLQKQLDETNLKFAKNAGAVSSFSSSSTARNNDRNSDHGSDYGGCDYDDYDHDHDNDY